METTSPRPNAGRRTARWPVALFLAVVALAGFYAVRTLHRRPPAGLPEVPVEGTDREVVELLGELRQTVIDRPRDALTWGTLGEAFLANDLGAEAAVCLRRAHELNEGPARWPDRLGVALENRSPDASLTWLRKAAASDQLPPLYLSAARLRLAEALARQEAHAEAQPLFEEERARAVYPARAAFGLATTLLAAGDYGGCVQALETVGDDPQARKKAASLLALASRFLGEEEAATRWQEKAQALPDDVPWFDPFAADCLQFSVGRRARFRQAKELELTGQLHEAGEILEGLVRDYPDPRSHSALGINLLARHRYAEAEHQFRQALALEPRHFAASYHLGLIRFHEAERLQTQGKPEEAARVLREAVSLLTIAAEEKADHAYAHLFLGRSLWLLGEKEKGLAGLRRALAIRPQDDEAHYHLGLALAEQGEHDLAAHHLREAQRYAAADDQRAVQALERLGMR